MDYPAPVSRLIDELRKLPGIGPKSAQRIVFHLMRGSRDDATRLSEAVGTLLDGIRTCVRCHAITDQEVCAICSDAGRSGAILCVVEEPHDLLAIERTRDFKGHYHVLHGALSPLQGIGPDELRLSGLLERVREGGVDEVILATSPTVEGEATAVYLARLLKPLGTRVTRIAMGVPVGSDLEWADEVTMAKSLEGRRDY
jgi:recombination protein RecR